MQRTWIAAIRDVCPMAKDPSWVDSNIVSRMIVANGFHANWKMVIVSPKSLPAMFSRTCSPTSACSCVHLPAPNGQPPESSQLEPGLSALKPDLPGRASHPRRLGMWLFGVARNRGNIFWQNSKRGDVQPERHNEQALRTAKVITQLFVDLIGIQMTIKEPGIGSKLDNIPAEALKLAFDVVVVTHMSPIDIGLEKHQKGSHLAA
jgi:hypothetical protein